MLALTKPVIEKIQVKLSARMVDGKLGRETFGLLLASAVGRKVDPIIAKVADAMAKYAAEYGMTTSAERLFEFIAQIANETNLKTFEEDLRYSAAALARTWPTRYSQTGRAGGAPNQRAKDLAYRPEAIANDTYALRMGNESAANDNDSHPDGWQYRGRGLLQLTGKSNYAAFGPLVGLDLVAFPDLASDPGVSCLIALAFFKKGNVNAAVDRGDFLKARQITNGRDAIGLANVARIRNSLLKLAA